MAFRIYILFFAILTLCISGKSLAIESATLASETQVQEAVTAFQNWLKLYQAGQFRDQYALVHPRIQKYKSWYSWKKVMRNSIRNNGTLKNYEIITYGATTPDKIPCTETGNCYRKDIQVVVILLNTDYEKIGRKEKEYVVMANSEAGWRFGGGTVLNLPFGETITIFDRTDEKRYEFNPKMIIR